MMCIIINNEILNKYHVDYFSKYPKRKVKPIEKPIPPSLNRFIAMPRMMQNSVKQKYKEFAVWLASYYNIANLMLEKAEIDYTFYFPDRRRRDMDNLLLTAKFLNDGWVLAHTLIDDNGERLIIRFSPFNYDSKNPRVEITITDRSSHVETN